MALKLILTRHAKSDWNTGLEDFERPLNPRGRKAAASVGKWLTKKGYLPDAVLVSGARRTLQTWEHMAGTMPNTVMMESIPALYHASADTILSVLQSHSAQTLMLIAHNPGIGVFAGRVTKTPPDHIKFGQYPTAATTVIEFREDTWKKIGWGRGEVLDFVVPRDLA